ncbi:MAG TPA: DUF58 domain-containing protein [Thiopseudomonas sp.]|nr:DUF58 domain-containing protein [Thiopseudomonas sp.]
MIIKPSPRLLYSVAGLLLLAIGLGTAHVLTNALPAWLELALLTTILAFILLCLIDAWRVSQQPPPAVQRVIQKSLSLGRRTEVTLKFSYAGENSVMLHYLDHLPDSFKHQQSPNQISITAQQTTSSSYWVTPLLRGQFILPGCAIRLLSPMGLWTAQHFLAHSSQVKVYPDFRQLHSGQLHTTEMWLKQQGVQQQQRRGSGLEFHQLRDYRSDDSMRHIDWKATARKRTPITREYQDERDQQVILLLDCGRTMRSQDGSLSHLDHAFNASLMLAYTALRLGDAVGIQTFAGPQRSIAPRKGLQQMSALLNGIYDIQASSDCADYSQAIERLLLQQKRRALVIIISNLVDETNSELSTALQHLNKRHRSILVSLKEETLDEIRLQPVQNYQQALLYCGSIDFSHARQLHHHTLRQQGIQVLDVRPSQLSTSLLNQYLKIKKSGLY